MQQKQFFKSYARSIKLDGEQEWKNAYTLGGELGYSKDEVRNALWNFATDGQHFVEIDHIRIEQVRLTTLGKQRCESVFPRYRS